VDSPITMIYPERQMLAYLGQYILQRPWLVPL
jgi:hypothetical protein